MACAWHHLSAVALHELPPSPPIGLHFNPSPDVRFVSQVVHLSTIVVDAAVSANQHGYAYNSMARANSP